MEEEFLIVPGGAPDSYCRLCLSTANVEPLLEATNEFLLPKQTLVQLIKRYMEIDLSFSVNNPCGICSTCRFLLEQFENFRERCLRCDFALNGKQRNGIQSESSLPFQCSECPIKFLFKSEYEKHWKSFHDLPHHCDRCDARFSMVSLLKFHQFRYHGNATVDSLKVSCSHCPRVFADEKQLLFHIQVLHGPAPNENESDHPTKKTKLVFDQQNAQSKKPFECDVCRIQYHFSGSLRRHMSDTHGMKLGDWAGTGRRRGATVDQIEIPQPEIAVTAANSSTPVTVPPFVITNISKNPRIKSELPDPVSTTSVVVFPDYDQKPFIDDLSQIPISRIDENQSIEVHQHPELCPLVIAVKRLDPNLVPPILNYEIPLKRIFYTQKQQPPELDTTEQLDRNIPKNCRSYKRKNRKLHSTGQHDHNIPKKRKRNRKVFVCKICQKQFFHASSLSVHKQFVHEGVAYPCNECGRRFALRTTLGRHLYQHMGELRYKCDECPMSFIEHCKLREHKNTYHVPGAPTLFIHFCPYCNRAFTKKASLHGHVTSIHREQYMEGAHQQAASTEM
ncbi:zinc finger protein 41-like [Armigeres subalbatus]|uniref:zinc finger protein 41-like n=1 Tax=Armigeres subalbatus TaxID=124917 RepID=UPI002ED629B9